MGEEMVEIQDYLVVNAPTPFEGYQIVGYYFLFSKGFI